MRTFLQDLRYGARMLLKKPDFTLIAALTLAFGVGANTAIFSFIDTLFFRPLPVREPNRLVKVYGQRNESRNRELSFAYPEYAYFRDHSASFEALAAHYSTSPLKVVADGESREAQGAVVSANYFPMLGVRPLLGRFFLPEEDAAPDRDPVAVISFGYWQHRFGGDPAILGKRIRINGTDFQVIGVAPEDFHGVIVGIPNEVWIPSMMLRVGYRWCDGFNYDCDILGVIGRLTRERTLAEAQAEMSVLAGQLALSNPATNRGKGVTLVQAIGAEPQERRESNVQIQLAMAGASLLLLIACANVAGLLIMRGSARRKEIAVRLCIGAGRARLIRQLLTESLLLAVAGAALGLLLSLWAKDLLMSFYTTEAEGYARYYDVSLNLRVLAYSLALSIGAGLLFGLAPAIQSARQDPIRALKDGAAAPQSGRNRLRGALVVFQVALSIVLLVASGLLVRSAANVRKGANFDPSHVALLRLRPRLVQYRPEKAQAFTREVIRRLELLPGVQSVSLARGVGFAWLSNNTVSVSLPERAADPPEKQLQVDYHEIAPRFFETLKIPLIQGRDFDDHDRPGSPRVVVINETLAQKMWPDGSPLERVLILRGQPYQVVGVFRDARLRNALEGPLPFLYVPYWQNNFEPQIDSRMVVRVKGDPLDALPLLRREIAAVDPNVPISEDLPLTEQLDGVYRPVLMMSNALVCAGVIAFFLSMIGLYATLAFAVGQRTREIGVRVALGAQTVDVLKLVIRQGMVLALSGVMIGLGAAFALTRVMASLLYGVSAADPLTFALIALLLIAVALLACWIPARRATKVDPMIALRCE